jgi:hypothetical protein
MEPRNKWSGNRKSGKKSNHSKEYLFIPISFLIQMVITTTILNNIFFNNSINESY